jgi:WD40 repeat protein
VTGESGAVELRDVTTGRRLRPPLPGLGHPAQALEFSPQGDRLAAADLSGNLRLLDLETGNVRREQLEGFLVHLSFSPDGGTLAVGLDEPGVELRDGRTLRRLARLRSNEGGLWVRFSPDGKRLAVTADDGSTRLWDVARRRPDGAALAGHESSAIAGEFSPDGRTLATSSWDGTVILFDVRSRRALGTLPGPAGAVAPRFTPDGRRLFVLRETGEALRWEVTADAWSRHACGVAGRELTRAEWAELVPDEDYRRVCR